jgi:hypothetical protein
VLGNPAWRIPEIDSAGPELLYQSKLLRSARQEIQQRDTDLFGLFEEMAIRN